MEQAERFIRPADVFRRIGFQDTTVREMVKHNLFPQPVLVGVGKVKRRVWLESEVSRWLEEQVQLRDQRKAA